jgi:GTP diphosphokinase / guanosine-3',5'-bis(diphosphate) 3'-diphosphatase
MSDQTGDTTTIPRGHNAWNDHLESVRSIAERSDIGRLAWALQDAEDERAPRSIGERIMGHRVRPEESCVLPGSTYIDRGLGAFTLAGGPLQRAISIATKVHLFQTDKAGEPYLFHCYRVAMNVESEQERCVAMMHDVLEDASDPRAWSEVIFHEFELEISHAVHGLWHRKDEPYQRYIERVANFPLAAAVKMQDIKDNLRHERLAKLPADEQERLTIKYRTALNWLSCRMPYDHTAFTQRYP